jgi:hypothetical protein
MILCSHIMYALRAREDMMRARESSPTRAQRRRKNRPAATMSSKGKTTGFKRPAPASVATRDVDVLAGAAVAREANAAASAAKGAKRARYTVAQDCEIMQEVNGDRGIFNRGVKESKETRWGR